MDALAKMIYEKWSSENDDRDLFFESGEKLITYFDMTLSREKCDKVYNTFCDSCNEIEEKAFIEGLNYAFKCIAEGKIDFSSNAGVRM